LTIEDESPSDTTNLAKINRYLESFHKSLEIAKQIGDRQRQTITLGNLGAVYGNLKNYEKAIDYFKPTNINSRCDRPTPYSNST